MSPLNSKLILGLCCLVAIVVALPKRKKDIIIIHYTDGDRIVNGQNITIDEFPYIVQILDKYPLSESNTGFMCGGTVVSDRHIISAAHCYHGYNPSDLVVVANATYVKGDEGAVRRDVEAIYKHPKYDMDTTDYDVVVIKLKEPLPMQGSNIKAAKMCNKAWDKKVTIQVSGWGHTVERATTHSNQLQTVFLQTMSSRKCGHLYKELTARMSCSIVSNNKDACQGDSGGPAFFRGELCGVVSFGFGCGHNDVPAVFTSIPAVRDFINSSMLK